LVPISLMTCWQAGVMDTVFAIPGAGQDALERDLAPCATGVMTVIGAFQVDRAIAAFEAITVAKTPPANPGQVEIETKFALAQPYRLDRMRQAMSKRLAGLPVDPIRIARIDHPDFEDISIVLKGAHRAYAARQSGIEEMNAIVDEVWQIDPKAFCVVGHRLIRRRGASEPAHSISSANDGPEIPVEVCLLLAFLGTEVLPAIKPSK
jgi:hypothetical protein